MHIKLHAIINYLYLLTTEHGVNLLMYSVHINFMQISRKSVYEFCFCFQINTSFEKKNK